MKPILKPTQAIQNGIKRTLEANRYQCFSSPDLTSHPLVILNFDSSECPRIEPKGYNGHGIWETVNQLVVGSSPTAAAIYFRTPSESGRLFCGTSNFYCHLDPASSFVMNLDGLFAGLGNDPFKHRNVACFGPMPSKVSDWPLVQPLRRSSLLNLYEP